MGGLECVITGLMDEFSIFFKEKKYAREIFTLIVIITSFSVALINVTPVSSLYYHLVSPNKIFFPRVVSTCFIYLTHIQPVFPYCALHCLKQLLFHGSMVK